MRRFATDDGCVHGFVVCERCDKEVEKLQAAEFMLMHTRDWVRDCINDAHARGLVAPDETEREKRRKAVAEFIVSTDKEHGKLFEMALAILEEIEWRNK